jgi:putative PIN family toxin of toxin-antitoxin system
LRFVFDTNVVVSAALLEESTSRRGFDRALDRGRLLISLPVVAELHDVLHRKRFHKYIQEDEAKRFLAALLRQAEWVEAGAKIAACRDPEDDKFLELAVNVHAGYIVTGDKDLLTLDPFRGISILTPDAFLAEM